MLRVRGDGARNYNWTSYSTVWIRDGNRFGLCLRKILPIVMADCEGLSCLAKGGVAGEVPEAGWLRRSEERSVWSTAESASGLLQA